MVHFVLYNIFTACIRSLGQAGLATFTRSNPLLQEARQSYGRAIQMVNQAIASETDAKKDVTILSVLILGMLSRFRAHDYVCVNRGGCGRNLQNSLTSMKAGTP